MPDIHPPTHRAHKVILFANTDWYLWNFRRALALAARDAGYEVLLLSPDGNHAARFAALGLAWQPLPMDRRSLNPLRELRVLWRLYRLFRRERPALVHAFTIKCAVYASLAARAARVPARVNAVAGMGSVFSSDALRMRVLRRCVHAMFRLALGGAHARLILQNPDDVALFERARLCEASYIRLIRGSGVDCTRFVPRVPATGATGGRPLRVLLAARLLWDKGIGEYADAARALRARGLSATFLLAGDPDPGNPAAVPQAAVREWCDEGVLDWLGHVDDMLALFQSVDIVVLPSYYREGVPRSLIEAAACGLPLVACDAPGCREIVLDDVTGLAVPPRDAPALVAAIARLLGDAALRARLGAAARARAVAEFDQRSVLARTLDVYRELLPETRPVAGANTGATSERAKRPQQGVGR